MHNKDKAEVSTISVHCVVCQKTFSKQWNLKRHQQKEHGLTEKGNIVQNSLGMAVFTTEALVKERVIQKVHPPLFSAISVTTKQRQGGFLRDT